jgi:hypothetical protein
MLSIGAAAFAENGKMLGTFSRNLHTLEGAKPHPDTQAWWDRHLDAYAKTRVDLVSPERAMLDFDEWVCRLALIPVFVAYPAGFDFTFVYWYMMRFVGKSPFAFSALDIKSYAMAKLGTPFRETVKGNMPPSWFPREPHSHVAVEDAIEQGCLFLAARAYVPKCEVSHDR